MTSILRFQSSYVLSVVLALGACTSPARDMPDPESDGGQRDDGAASVDAGSSTPPDAHGDPDAASTPPDAMPGDSGGGTGGDTGTPGLVSCYSEGSPEATCTLPVHCCFTNYSSQHNGNCSTETCTYGTIECDGPEDCASGQYCCAHALSFGYKLACQDSACGPAPANQELCHPTSSSLAGTCSSAAACVTAYGNDNDLPRTLNICQ